MNFAWWPAAKDHFVGGFWPLSQFCFGAVTRATTICIALNMKPSVRTYTFIMKNIVTVLNMRRKHK